MSILPLSAKTESFVHHFGEMGSRWGFNRTVGQMLALMVIHPTPLNADQISQLLGVSRGNVSMGIKELQSWRLIKTKNQAGDRKDYFTAAGSIWDLARTVFEERSRREIAPTLSLLRSQLLEPPQDEADLDAQKKIEEIHDILELVTEWSNSLNSLKLEQIQSLMKLGSGISKALEFKDKITGKDKHD